MTSAWWYTTVSIVTFQVFLLAVCGLGVVVRAARDGTPVVLVLYTLSAFVSIGSAIALLWHYRRADAVLGGLLRELGSGRRAAAFGVFALSAALVGAAALGLTSGSPLLSVGMAAYSLCLLRWRRIRLRLVVLLLLALAAVWAVEPPQEVLEGSDARGYPYAVVALIFMMPPITALSLWWWDIVVELDRARAAERRLASAQERLRFATDLHDLQGHHLQVIALQLELADRMLDREPAAAAEQIRLARASVDEARSGTRALAERFRGVPLPDELANAGDLLHAAGVRVDLDIAAEAEAAPSDVLGPVVREGTTNILKHGGGAWARFALTREASAWRLRISNDRGTRDGARSSGSGLTGIAERVGAVGGTLGSRAGDDDFEIVVTVPFEGEAPR